MEWLVGGNMKVLKNSEVKNLIIKILVVQLIFAIIIGYSIQMNNNNTLDIIVNTKASMIASLDNMDKDTQYRIIDNLVTVPSKEEIENGKKILKEYGYTYETAKAFEPVVTNNSNILIKVEIVLMILLIITIIIILIEMKKVYSKVKVAYTYANEVIKGNYSQYLDYKGEGEFPILANEMNSMVDVIKNNLENLNDEKTFLKDMLTDISHQLKTPLTSIKMMNEIIITKEDLPIEKRRDFLNRISTQIERMEWLIYSLLKIARLESGKIEFNKESLELSEIVEDSVRCLEDKAKSKNIKITRSNTEGEILGDKEWTIEAFVNIIKNAIEHTPVDGTVDIAIETTSVFNRVTIKDSGEGINKKDLPNIFKRFYRGNSSLKTESIGVGLAMSKSIIERQNGYISVRTNKGKGTEFEITFVKNY